MTLNTSFPVGLNGNERKGRTGEHRTKGIPGIFFVTDENLNNRRASWGGEGRVRKKRLDGSGEEESTIVCKH